MAHFAWHEIVICWHMLPSGLGDGCRMASRGIVIVQQTLLYFSLIIFQLLLLQMLLLLFLHILVNIFVFSFTVYNNTVCFQTFWLNFILEKCDTLFCFPYKSRPRNYSNQILYVKLVWSPSCASVSSPPPKQLHRLFCLFVWQHSLYSMTKTTLLPFSMVCLCAWPL